MTMENLDNYFLNVIWRGLKNDDLPVGYFVLYNQRFYFKICGKESAPRAYQEGFDGRPGIIADKIYSSSEVFDTVNKILGLKDTEKDKIEILKEILVSKIEGKSALQNKRDNISFTKMKESDIEKCKMEIEEMEQQSNSDNESER